MRCPECKSKTRVIDARPSTGNFRRRRECLSCGYRFTTRERYVDPIPLDALSVTRAEMEVLLRTVIKEVEERETIEGTAYIVNKHKIPEAFVIEE
jgi:transcriptional repressor NrdR